MITVDKIKTLIEQKLAEDNYFIVSLDVLPGNKIRLIIDNMNGITIDECVAFSRAIEHNLNRDEEDFDLEVSSPGLDMPLKVKEQYIKNIDRELEVLTLANEKVVGKLLKVNNESILLYEEKRIKIEGHKKKQLVKNEHNISFEEINKAFVVIKF
jgi:ribosome maturation factor RimP